jgi:hypothetical protein
LKVLAGQSGIVLENLFLRPALSHEIDNELDRQARAAEDTNSGLKYRHGTPPLPWPMRWAPTAARARSRCCRSASSVGPSAPVTSALLQIGREVLREQDAALQACSARCSDVDASRAAFGGVASDRNAPMQKSQRLGEDLGV